MNDKQIITYVKNMIVSNLANNDCTKDVALLITDTTNRELLAHINGLIELFTKAKEILENKGDIDD